MEQPRTAWRWGAACSAGGLAAVVAAAYSALILAELGRFRAWPCIWLAFAAAAATAWIASRRAEPKSTAERAGWLAAWLLALLSMVMTLPPSEMLLGGWDPGVYLHTASSIANHGSLQIPVDDVAQLPVDLRPDLVVEIAGWKHPFPGMFPLPNGRLSPQFMHLYPSLMAVAYSLGGVQGALLLNPLLNATAILLMFWFASKILGPGWGLAAALLLAVNPAQTWQAKFGTAEMLGQILLLAGSGLMVEFIRRPRSIFSAALSGFLFGLAFFTRYDAILFLAPALLLVIALNPAREQRGPVFAFLLALAAVGIHAGWHMASVAPCYRPLPGLVFPLLAWVLALGSIFLVAGIVFPKRPSPSRWIPLRAACSVGLVCFIFFAGYLRPHLAVDGRISRLAASVVKPTWLSALAGPDAFNADYLTSIFGPFGLLLALAGLVALVWRGHDRATAIWLAASVGASALLVANVFHDHFMMWVSRRFIPVAIPLLVVGTAAAARELLWLGQRRGRLAAWALSGAALAAAILLGAPKTAAMASTRDWPGLADWLDDLARTIPENAVVFCDQPGFAAPLRFIYGIQAHEIHGGIGGEEFALRHRQTLANLDPPALVLTMRGVSPNPDSPLRLLEQFDLSSHIQEQPRRSIPFGTKWRGGTFSLCAVERQEKMDNSHAKPAK